MSSSIPLPPPAENLDPAITTWNAGLPMTRAHGHQYEPAAFNSTQGLDFRFSSIVTDAGTPIGVLYCADSLSGALSETLFHTLSADGDRLKPRTIPRATVEKFAISVIGCNRPLRLIDLTGHGIGREGMPITHGELILSGAIHYASTRLWAKAFHDHPEHVDGFLWVSRQYNLAKAMMLFGDRVDRDALVVVEGPLLAGRPPMIDKIEDEARKARVVITN